MVTSVEEIQSYFANIGNCQVVGDGMLRCVRNPPQSKNPMAIYWVDARGQLPKDTVALLNYQSELFGSDYYRLPKDIQLNHYLFFVFDPQKASKEQIVDARNLIERDVSYARKFVVSPEELHGTLADLENAFKGPSAIVVATDQWRAELSRNRLSAVYDDLPRAQVIRQIEQGLIGPAADSSLSLGAERAKESGVPKPVLIADVPTVEAVRLSNFGRYPTRKEFQLGLVTLVHGKNGVGKTSVLEGIEFAFCGENFRGERRVAEGSPLAEIRLKGSSSYTALGSTNQERLDLDAAWFGAYARRIPELSGSFNQYVYFNSDAAVLLEHARNRQDLDEALQKIAIGPEASKLWGRIKEYESELKQVLVRRENAAEGINRQIRDLDGIKERLGVPGANVDEAFQRAKDALERLGLKQIPKSLDHITPEFASNVAAISESFKAIMGSVAWLPEATVGKIAERQAVVSNDLTTVRRIQDQLDTNLQASRAVEAQLKVLTEKLSQIDRYKLYLNSAWAGTRIEIMRLEAREAAFQLLSDSTARVETDLRVLQTNEVLGNALKWVADRQTLLEQDIASKRRDLQTLQTSLTERAALVTQIRALSARYLSIASHIDDCPVCRTVFAPEELRARVDAQYEAASSEEKDVSLRTAELQTLEREHADTLRLRAALGRLEKIGNAVVGQALDKTVGTLLNAYQERLNQHVEDAQRVALLRATLSELAVQGFREEEFNDLAATLDLNKEDVLEGHTRRLDSVAKELTNQIEGHLRKKAELDLANTAATRSVRALHSAYQLTYPSNTSNLSEFLQYLTERQKRLDNAHAMCKDLAAAIDIPDSEPIREQVLRSLVAKDRVSDLAVLVDRERARQTELSGTMTRLQQLKIDASELTLQAHRLEAALAAVVDLQKKLPLEDLTREFFERNWTRINEVFRLLHAPREFTAIRTNRVGTGVRIELLRDDKTWVVVNQISTGQRTALALAIFFTLNEKLSVGPKLALMDDPVANVDDLNTLAFFDYLREVALTGRRQLVYATANDRMAALFQNKFAFLGRDLVIHMLSRPVAVQ